MPKVMQSKKKRTRKRKAAGVHPPRSQSVSSDATGSDATKKLISFSHSNLKDSDLVKGGIRYSIKNMEELRLSDNCITLGDGTLVNAILTRNTTLKALDLSKNKISKKGMKHLAKALKYNRTLKILYLHDNNIGNEGAKYLAGMLIGNRSLQKIYLGNNNIGDKGATSIAASLVVNTSVSVADNMSNNKFTVQGAEKLVDALENKISFLGDPKIFAKQSPLGQLEYFITRKDKEITKKETIIEQCKEEIAMLEKHMVSKDEEILKKEAVKNCEVTEKNRAIAKVLGVITKRNNEIAMLKESLKNSKSIETVDLTSGDENEHTSNKRQRTEAKSNLAIQHEQNLKIVKVKEEKVAAETALKDVREDLEDNQEDMGRQVLFTDFLQSKIDELAALAEAGGVDRAQVAEIKGRSYSSMSS